MSLPVPAGMQPILQAAIVLSPTTPQRVLIPDEVEGDMTFTFQLCSDVTDPESYTKLNIIDDFHAEIQIYNANPQLSVRPTELISAGTYKRDYALYTTYELNREEVDGKRKCLVGFYTERIDHGSKD